MPETRTKPARETKDVLIQFKLTQGRADMLDEFAALCGMTRTDVLTWLLHNGVQNALAIAHSERVNLLTKEEFSETLKGVGNDHVACYIAILKLLRLRMPDWREFFVTCEAAGNPLKMERFNRFYGLTATDPRAGTAEVQMLQLNEDGGAHLAEIEHSE